MKRNPIGVSALAAVAAFAVACPGVASAQPKIAAGPQAVVTATNGILTLEMENANTSTLGMWSVLTGASHPNPNQRVIYPIGTSYITVRDATSNIMYANVGSANAGLAGYTFQNISTAPGGTAVVSSITGGYRAQWAMPPNWTVQQDVVINGSTLADTNVRQTVTVCNTSTATRQYGVRFMWDWMIAGNDASFFRTRNPDTAFTNVFQTFNAPAFQLFEEVNNINTPAFSVFGTVTGGPLVPPPTPPEQLRYSNWGNAQSNAWDFPNTGSGSDSATEHYWGFSAPLSLAASACASYTQYLTTNLSAVGGGTPAPATVVPTNTEWGLLLMATLLAGAAMWTMRGRRG